MKSNLIANVISGISKVLLQKTRENTTSYVVGTWINSVNFYQLCLAAIHARPGRKTIITDAANFPTDRYILDGIAQPGSFMALLRLAP